MDILDLRPALERWLASRGATTVPVGPAARLAGRIADGLAARRADRRLAPPTGILVISVGNLRVGGTGKTPVTVALARDLAGRGIAGAIVTRGHGSPARGPLVVAPADERAADEARLMAGALAGTSWRVVQARRRDRGLTVAVGSLTPRSVVILEDGHQTGRAGRHLDVVILDAWQVREEAVEPLTGPVVPFGPYRETARGAARAGIWLLEDAAPPPGPAGVTVTGFTRRPSLGATVPADARVALLSGLARPEGFERSAGAVLGDRVVLAVRCRDHARYDDRLLERLLAEGRRRGVEHWLTSAKDRVKLTAIWPPDLPLLTLESTVVWTGRETLPDLVEERLAALGA